ncbi:MAG: DUF4126 domain-containing protein [Chloroflexi bacterium]|nr:DUF4126 domain-containing protein [Chloroflexota bacterium]
MSIFTAFGLSASAGLNAYIPLLVIALLARYTNLITLDPQWQALTHPAIIALLAVLAGIEFFADKIPAVNHINDAIQTVVRPVAGAIAFAAGSGAIGSTHPVLALAVGLLVAGSVHATKSLAVRPAVSLTTGGVANTPVSMAEDAVALSVSLLAIIIPVALLVIAVGVLFWAWRRWRRTTPA